VAEYLFWDLGSCVAGTRFQVQLDGCAANVFLVDDRNFSAYQREARYRYHGGFYDYTPIVLQVPYDDDWTLIMDDYHDAIEIEIEELD
jgi:hypothetical protein